MSTKPTFTWSPDIAAARDIKPSVKQVKFGDGYESRIPIGINTMPRNWNVVFTRSRAEALAIDAFLQSCSGVQSFLWTDPKNDQNTFVCRDWKFSQQEFGIYSISATFEQVFEA